MARWLTTVAVLIAFSTSGQIDSNPNVDATSSHTLQTSELYVHRYLIRQPGVFVHALAYFDYDGDGDLDAFTSGGDGSNSITRSLMYLNDGTGQFRSDPTFFGGSAPGQIHPRKALKADFNGDGRIDLFVIGHGYDQPPFPGEAPYVLLSSPSGFAVGTGLSSFTGFQHGGAAADVDADGDVDVFVADTAEPFFLLNDGSGGFTRNTAMIGGIDGASVFTAELVDVDKDGFVDLLVAGHEQDGFASQILWGASTGTYTTQRRTLIPAVAGFGTVIDIDVADLNDDGRKDLVLNRTGGGNGSPGFYAGYYVQVVEQDASRSLTDVSATWITENTRTDLGWFDWIRLQDVDGDGLIDILVDNATENKAWLGNGTSFVFTELRPAEVFDLEATLDLPDRVDVTWSAVADATGYVVYRREFDDVSGDFVDERIVLAENLSETSFSDYGADENGSYGYFVAARRGIAVGDAYSSAYGQRLQVAPSIPNNVVASNGTFTDKVRITWDALSNAESYQVFRNSTPNSDTATPITGQISETSFDDVTAETGVFYTYYVKATNIVGTSDFGGYVTGLRAHPRPLRPTVITASDDVYPDRIRVTWNAVANATSYQVYRSEESGIGTAVLLAEVFGTVYNDFAARPNIPTRYWVRSKGPGGASAEYGGPATGLRNLANDTDGDGLPDDWEIANQLDLGDPNDAKLDVDGDGFSALQEYVKNTDPQRYVITLKRGWNLIGIGRQPEDNNVETMFGDLIEGTLWHWGGRRFQRTDRLEAHKGYWLYSPEGGDAEIDLGE